MGACAFSRDKPEADYAPATGGAAGTPSPAAPQIGARPVAGSSEAGRGQVAAPSGAPAPVAPKPANDDRDDAGTAVTYPHAVASWFAALDDANASILGFELPPVAPLEDVTVRQIAHLSLGGEAIRIRFSNEYGAAPITLSRVRVAKSSSEAAIDPSTDTAVTFEGATSITLQPKAEAWSDDIALAVASNGDIAISIHVQRSTDIATEHRFAQRTNYIAFGDVTTAPDITGFFDTTGASYWMREIVVLRSEPAEVVVAFGDSITDGFNSTPDRNLRYPDQLSERDANHSARSIVNAGIGGNRWLHGGLGPAAAERFARDALQVTGVRDVVIMMGINDIGFGSISQAEAVTLDQLKTAIGGAVSQARAAGLRVFLGTLPPFGECFYYTEEGETMRQGLNAWILSNQDVTGVVDFDRALRDPANARTLDPRYDSGDQLHPNDQGYGAMADAVDRALSR